MRHLFITFRPRFTTTRPPSVITDRRRYTGVTTTGYVIIVIAAVAIDHTMHAMVCPIRHGLPDQPYRDIQRCFSGQLRDHLNKLRPQPICERATVPPSEVIGRTLQEPK